MERTALNLSVTPQTLAKPWAGVFANNLKLYIGVLLVVAVASYAFWLNTRFIFACQASGYSASVALPAQDIERVSGRHPEPHASGMDVP
jgi:hypothetical protein